MTTRIGVFGYGFVGKVIYNYFKDMGHDVWAYDISGDCPNAAAEVVLNSSYIFVAVPTPFEANRFDDTAVLNCLLEIDKGNPEAVVIIKSTVLPGKTERYQELFPRMNILFNPEFLTEATAKRDFMYPDHQIVGYTKKLGSEELADEVLNILPRGTYVDHIVEATEAEFVKYLANCFYALKVSYANQMYDLANAIGVDYFETIDLLPEMVGPNHLDVLHKGYRGYGGKCLPKDTKSILELAKSVGVELSLLTESDRYNDTLS